MPIILVVKGKPFQLVDGKSPLLIVSQQGTCYLIILEVKGHTHRLLNENSVRYH